MQESILVDLILPLSLVVIMVGLGMSLSLSDFRRVVEFPRAAMVGLGCQLVLLPLVGFGLVVLFGLPPIWAVGLMLIAACPGGATSNLITFVSRGDTALSITLTALSSAATVVTISIEAGIQNGTLAIVLAMSVLGVAEMAVPPGVYSLLMFVSGGLVMGFFGVFRAPSHWDRVEEIG